jgi:hypothetical protein
MTQLAKEGGIPQRLAKITVPLCAACFHGKQTKTPWRTKEEPKTAPKVAAYPGECIAVDQLESRIPGFVAQLKAPRLTKHRYHYSTVFVDHYSDFTYIHFHMQLTSEETMKAKHAFELLAANHGVQIHQYHADNGHFQDLAFKQECEQKGQRITYCGVNAHFQNGRAEKKIRDLQDAARTSLLHAIKKWPTAITIHLWPFAMRYAMDCHNALPLKDRGSPLELFSSTLYEAPLRQFHHFRCPTFKPTRGVG